MSKDATWPSAVEDVERCYLAFGVECQKMLKSPIPAILTVLIKFFSAHQVRKRESMHASGLALKEYQ